jgi:hypothetical protein
MTKRTLTTRIIPLLPLAATVPASAVIVYTDNAVGPAEPGLYFDFETSTPMISEAIAPGRLAYLYYGFQLVAIWSNYTKVSANLSAGTTIDSSLSWSNYSDLQQVHTPILIGIRAAHMGEHYYGWAEVSYSGGSTGTIHRFAMETSANTAILAGDTGAVIPEPSTYAAMAGLLAGSAALYAKRRRTKLAA